MLQISTGKFFRPVPLYETPHQGVLYTNYRLADAVVTAAGVLRPPESREVAVATGSVATMGYDTVERLEGVMRDGRPSFLVAVGGEHMTRDFAAVTAFGLAVTCTPDAELARRLTRSEGGSLGAPRPPNAYVPRVFDATVTSTPEELAGFERFVADLVGLERAAFEAAMRAVRRYVTGLQRVDDDPDLAYALLVASVESLAQTFDDFVPTWEDYEPRRRTTIDAALTDTDASATTRERVRAAVLAGEHARLARRYREFAIAHLEPGYFREEAAGQPGAPGRRDLPGMLDRAYALRSGYVHRLSALPGVLTLAPSGREVDEVDVGLVLSFRGMARLARHVIRTFVMRGRKVEREETFDYRTALPNVIKMRLADAFWLPDAAGFDHGSARRYLGGFLGELAAVLQGVAGATVSDLSAVLAEIERLAPGLAPAQRLPMLTLYGLWHRTAPSALHRPDWEALLVRYTDDFATPSIEGLVSLVLLGPEPKWPPEVIDRTVDAYAAQRGWKGGLQLPGLLEAALALTAAETWRAAGDDVRARGRLSSAVEDYPGLPGLLQLERAAERGPIPPIQWEIVLLPPADFR